jgi:hypothetical protein
MQLLMHDEWYYYLVGLGKNGPRVYKAQRRVEHVVCEHLQSMKAVLTTYESIVRNGGLALEHRKVVKNIDIVVKEEFKSWSSVRLAVVLVLGLLALEVIARLIRDTQFSIREIKRKIVQRLRNQTPGTGHVLASDNDQ